MSDFLVRLQLFKFQEAMDLSLWDAPVVQVGDDRHFCNRNDWYCDFHFGYGQDVIEEDALNETSCMQVLKILIAKTDDEIMQLEYSISVLETSLGFANTELSQLCSVVRERSDCLAKSIQLCKDVYDEHDPGFQLQAHKEPAERVHEIIKGPPCKDLQQKTDQLASAPMRSPFLVDDYVGSQKAVRRIFVPETEETQNVTDSLHNDEMEDPSANPHQKMEGILESNCCNSNISSIANILVNSSSKVSGEDLENTDGRYDSELEMKGLSSTSSKGGRKVNCSKTYESKCLIRPLIEDVNEYPVEKEAVSNVGCVTEVREQSLVSMPSSDGKVVGSAPRSKTDTPVCFVEDSCRMQDHEKILETSRKKGSRKKPALSRKKKRETNSLLKIKGKRKRSPELEPICVDSLIELINGRNDANRPQKKVKGKLQANHIKEPEAFVANDSIKKEYTKMKKEHHVKQETVAQSLAEECKFNVASLEMIKRHKSDTAEFLGFNKTNIEREEGDIVGTKLADGSLTSIITTATHTPNGNNESTILPLSYENKDSSNLQIEHAKIHDIMMKIKLEESTEILSCSSTSDPRIQIAEKRLTVSDLELMTLPKLKDIAKRYNLKRYNKLTKAKLISFLTQELKLGSSHQ